MQLQGEHEAHVPGRDRSDLRATSQLGPRFAVPAAQSGSYTFLHISLLSFPKTPSPYDLLQSLRLEEPPEVELRVPVPSGQKGSHPQRRTKKKWVGAGDVQDPASSENTSGNAEEAVANTPATDSSSEEQCYDGKVLKNDTVTEIVRYRSSITNVGCGPIAVRLCMLTMHFGWRVILA